MKNLLFILTFFYGVLGYAHNTESIEISNVIIENESDISVLKFDLTNHYESDLQEVRVVVKDMEGELMGVVIKQLKKGTIHSSTVELKSPNIQLKDISIHIIRVNGMNANWAVWNGSATEKQVNTLASEFYADAPWRMKRFDDTGQELGIPVHFFLHDADLVPAINIKIDNINIQLKNATDTNFDPVLTYNSIPFNEFQSMFSCMSETDNDLDIKAFDLNSFSASGSQTIDFDIDSDFLDEFVEVTEKYWYFNFTIPASDLASYNDVVDILVRIEYANLTITDDLIGMRVFRKSEDLPSQVNWYRGDTHLHSMYTQNDAEIGLPLCATKEANKLQGIDWVTTTDHTSDFDNYGIDISNNWTRIQDECLSLNTADTSLIFVSGQEVAVNNTNAKLIHMLAYPNPNLPFSLPFLGDGDGDLFPTSVDVDDALSVLVQSEGFAYGAHPFSTGDELPEIPTNGGIWNLEDAGFPVNGMNFPETGGVIICNDIGPGSDVLSSAPNEYVKSGLVGGQIWNSRSNLESTGDELDPWDVQGNGGGFSQEDTSNIEFHFKRFREGQQIVNFINQRGLELKNADSTMNNWKFFYAAGTDAHGSFNSSNTGDFASLGTISNNATGKLNTVAYCPEGKGANGENILEALSSGRTTMSDGPLLTMGMSLDGDNSSDELLLGQDSILDIYSPDDYFLNVNYTTTPEFGDVEFLRVCVGTENGEVRKLMPITSFSGDNSVSYKMTDLLDSILGIANTPLDAHMYVRAEIKTNRAYPGAEELEQLVTYDIFHSITNPIWFRFEELSIGIDDLGLEKTKIYPNPTYDKINIEFDGYKNCTIHVVDQMGRQLLSQVCQGKKEELDVAKFARGVYLIKLSTSNDNRTIRFIKL